MLPGEIDYLLLCTQSPDYFLPTTACILQHRLGIPTHAGALDFNLGCSGFIYGLGLAQGLIQSGQASRVLLITAETYSKFIHPKDKSVRTFFGDAAAATLVCAAANSKGLEWLRVWNGWQRSGQPDGAGGRPPPAFVSETAQAVCDPNGNWRSADNLFMDGGEIFNFTLRAIPECVSRLLAQTGKQLQEIDLFVFHQANQYMLDHLRKKLKIPPEKFYLWLASCGNTVSSTIPIALKHAVKDGRLKTGHLAMLVGFGVGYSWGATLVQWPVLGYETVQMAVPETRELVENFHNRS